MFIFFLEAVIAQLLLFSVALFFGLSPFVYLPTYYLCKRVRSAAAKIVNTQHVFLIDPLVQSSKLLFLKVNKFNRKLLDGFLFQSELSLFGGPVSQCFLVEKDRNMGEISCTTIICLSEPKSNVVIIFFCIGMARPLA